MKRQVLLNTCNAASRKVCLFLGDNILLDETGLAKITDFGISRLLTLANVTKSRTGAAGTAHFMAPEVIHGDSSSSSNSKYSSKADIWYATYQTQTWWRSTSRTAADAMTEIIQTSIFLVLLFNYLKNNTNLYWM